MDRFECPTCHYESTSPGLKAALGFYPRLVDSDRLLTAEDIKLVGYTIGDIMNLGIYNWLKEAIRFECKRCGTEWDEKFDPDTLIVTSFEIRGTLSHDQAWVPDGAHGRS